MLLTQYCYFNFLTSILFYVGTFPVLLLILYYSSYVSILAAAICTVSSCFTDLAFPSHSSPAYPSFGTIILIRKHPLILLSRCGSVRITSILRTCAFYLLQLVSLCASQEHSSIFLRRGTHISLRPVIGLSLSSIRMLQSSPYPRYIYVTTAHFFTLLSPFHFLVYSRALSICFCNTSGVPISPRIHLQ